MSQNFANSQVRQYASTIELVLQQKGSKLRDTVEVKGGYRGNQAVVVEQIGVVEAQKRTTRYAALEPRDTPHDRPWVSPEVYDWFDMVDHFDKLKALVDPTGSYVQSAVMALGRRYDDEIIRAMFADRKAGETGVSTVSFPASQVVGVTVGAGGNTGMNLAKLRAAKKILMANEVDFDSEPVTIAVTAEEHDELLNETQMISLEFQDKPVLVEGKITRCMGFDFKHSEKLQLDGSGYRRIPVWAKSRVHLATWEEIYTSVDRRYDKSGHPWQVYAMAMFGATRKEEKGVVEIKCA